MTLPETLVAEPVIATAVLARVMAATLVATAALFPEATLRIRATLAVLLAAVALPLAASQRSPEPLAAWPLVVGGEAVAGLGLGLAVAVVLAAAAWAGGTLGSVAGLSWADDFGPAGEAQAAGMARLCRWLALGGFIAGGGHLTVVTGIVDSVRTLPIGTVAAGGGDAGLTAAVTALLSTSLALSVSLALPALTAVLVFHAASSFCVRTIRFLPGQGMVQSLTALALLAAVALGADSWSRGFGTVASERIAELATPAAFAAEVVRPGR